MWFGVLGPVELRTADGPVALSPRQRAVLAYLVLHAGTVISTDRLIGAIWGEDAPATARVQIQSAVSAIRKAAPGVPLETRPAGYLLSPRDTDLAHADAPGAWRGPALSDVDAAYVPAARTRLEARRLTAIERAAEAALAAGRPGEAVDALTPAATDHPAREGLASRLALALYRLGRQPEALETLRRLRKALAEDHGLDPGAETALLERRILRADPGLDHTAERASTRDGPAQLPAPPTAFTGRAAELDLLDGALADAGPAIVVTAGAGGVGKSALALHWAHRVAARFPDGRLYAHLGDTDPLPVLARFLRDLGVPAREVPADLDGATALYRDKTAGRRLLVLLDDARDTAQVRPLVPGRGGLALVTSRDRMAGLVALDGARRLTLAPLDEDEAVALLRGLIGPADPADLAELAVLCGRLPLALRIAAALIADDARPLAGHLAELRGPGRLAALDLDGEASVRAVIERSIAALPAEAAGLLRLLAGVPGPDIAAEGAAVLAATSEGRAELLLDRLAAAHLVEPTTRGRHGMHDLTRLYLSGRAEPGDGARRDALFEWYLHGADSAVAHLDPTGLRLAPLPAEPRFADAEEALAWLDAEHACLLAAIEAAPRPEFAWLLADALRGHHRRNRLIPEGRRSAGLGLAAAEAAGEDVAAAHMSMGLAHLAMHARDFDGAIAANRRAAALAEGAGAARLHGAILTNLGVVHVAMGRDREAIAHYRESIAVLEHDGASLVRANAHANLAGADRGGSFHTAVEGLGRALADFRELGHQLGQARALHGLAAVRWWTGETSPGLAEAEEAAALFAATGDVYLAAALSTWALHLLDAGDAATALLKARAAVARAREAADPTLENEARATLGHVLHALGEHDEAAGHFTAVIAWAEHEVGVDQLHAEALLGLAAVHAARGERARALALAERAVTRDYGQKSLAALVHGRASAVLHACGDASAREHAAHALALADEGQRRGVAEAEGVLARL
ncbi:SARP family transcriptional regulator [Actinorhabdospora filicis]|uniref:SARP family transcriptional regulator n=1 Tax=Actinorhabdospora filicis TaxID=1785913 RepID=A0A9W6SKK8_9ACTN|nr:BTAD domain-containing putative transcriptional regulator [Actinorhabdospora filicis]GLZ77379.1 SARP family transcriptional regulator [Actinorhabdospora filicis]